MKCIYYSCYPHANKDFKRNRVNASDYGCDWSGDALLMTFRVYRAAWCISVDKNVSVSEFLWNIYEALDMPNCKDIEDYHKPYILDGVKVFPTSYLYGATNPNDGIYEIDGRYYTIGNGDEITTHPNWESAFKDVHVQRGRYYLCGVNYGK